MSIKIDDNKRQALKILASIEGKTISSIVSNLIDQYVMKRKDKLGSIVSEDLKPYMKISEKSFKEWDNEEDSIYDKL